MVSKLLFYFPLAVVLLLVFVMSVLVSMRLAIHGREVQVPKLAGLTPVEAERVANRSGLVLSVESRFYTNSVPEGRIASQSPQADTRVRSGWKVVVAESLGPQRATIPNLVGQSERAADVNLGSRGLQVGGVTRLHLAGIQPGMVVAQSPLANSKNVASPNINLVVTAPDNTPRYVMPSFVGKSLADSTDALESAGFVVRKPQGIGSSTVNPAAAIVIVRQYPAAGTRVTAGDVVRFEVKKYRAEDQ